jgi:uncharacterized membrane protein YqjE
MYYDNPKHHLHYIYQNMIDRVFAFLIFFLSPLVYIFFNYGFTAQAFMYVLMVFYFMGLIAITRLVYWSAKDIFDDTISFFKGY